MADHGTVEEKGQPSQEEKDKHKKIQIGEERKVAAAAEKHSHAIPIELILKLKV